MRKELLSKKKPAFDYLGRFWSIRIAKVAKTRKFTVRKACSLWRVHQRCGYKPFTEEVRCVTSGSTQSSQQKPGIEMGLIRKDL